VVTVEFGTSKFLKLQAAICVCPIAGKQRSNRKKRAG
jgi:hypothetical protein